MSYILMDIRDSHKKHEPFQRQNAKEVQGNRPGTKFQFDPQLVFTEPTLFLKGVAKSISISWSLLVTPFSGEGGETLTAGTNTEAAWTGRKTLENMAFFCSQLSSIHYFVDP